MTQPLDQQIFFVFPDVALGLIILLVALPPLFKLVPMNRFYGFRIPQAFESEEAWYRINQEGARRLVPWSVLLFATAAAKWFSLDWLAVHVDERWVGLFLGGPVIVVSIMMLISMVRYFIQLQ